MKQSSTVSLGAVSIRIRRRGNSIGNMASCSLLARTERIDHTALEPHCDHSDWVSRLRSTVVEPGFHKKYTYSNSSTARYEELCHSEFCHAGSLTQTRLS